MIYFEQNTHAGAHSGMRAKNNYSKNTTITATSLHSSGGDRRMIMVEIMALSGPDSKWRTINSIVY